MCGIWRIMEIARTRKLEEGCEVKLESGVDHWFGGDGTSRGG
jgi:hypothetical protein